MINWVSVRVSESGQNGIITRWGEKGVQTGSRTEYLFKQLPSLRFSPTFYRFQISIGQCRNIRHANCWIMDNYISRES